MHDYDQIRQKMDGFKDIEGAIKRIEISEFLNSRERSPRFTFAIE